MGWKALAYSKGSAWLLEGSQSMSTEQWYVGWVRMAPMRDKGRIEGQVVNDLWGQNVIRVDVDVPKEDGWRWVKARQWGNSWPLRREAVWLNY